MPAKSFDYAVLEKIKKINGIKMNTAWSDLGSWSEILKCLTKINQNILKKKIFIIDRGGVM